MKNFVLCFVICDVVVWRNRRFFDGYASDGIDEFREYWKFFEFIVEIFVVVVVVGVCFFSCLIV